MSAHATPITDRITALRLAMEALCKDQRPNREIALAIEARSAETLFAASTIIWHHPPRDKLLAAMCEEYGIPIDLEVRYLGDRPWDHELRMLIRNGNGFSMADIPRRPRLELRRLKFRKGQTSNNRRCLVRQEALQGIFQQAFVDRRSLRTIAKAFGIPYKQLQRILVDGELPNDRNLTLMAKGYGFDLPPLSDDQHANPRHYKGFDVPAPRAATTVEKTQPMPE